LDSPLIIAEGVELTRLVDAIVEALAATERADIGGAPRGDVTVNEKTGAHVRSA
jgi:hypothetical protein